MVVIHVHYDSILMYKRRQRVALLLVLVRRCFSGRFRSVLLLRHIRINTSDAGVKTHGYSYLFVSRTKNLHVFSASKSECSKNCAYATSEKLHTQHSPFFYENKSDFTTYFRRKSNWPCVVVASVSNTIAIIRAYDTIDTDNILKKKSIDNN